MLNRNFFLSIIVLFSMYFNCSGSHIETLKMIHESYNKKVLNAKQVKAIKNGEFVAVKRMIEVQGFSTESTDGMGNTMLILALSQVRSEDISSELYVNKIHVAKYLIKMGANIEATAAASTETPLLLISSFFGLINDKITGNEIVEFNGGNDANLRYDLILLLIWKKVDLNAKDLFGRDALYYAIRSCDERLVRLLIHSGVDLSSSYVFNNERNLGPMDLAYKLAEYFERSNKGLAEKYRKILNILRTYQENLINTINQYLLPELSQIVARYAINEKDNS